MGFVADGVMEDLGIKGLVVVGVMEDGLEDGFVVDV